MREANNVARLIMREAKNVAKLVNSLCSHALLIYTIYCVTYVCQSYNPGILIKILAIENHMFSNQ